MTRWVFFRLLGLVYLFAFWSLADQILGLAGHDGVLPAQTYMDSARAWAAAEHVGLDRLRLVPTVFWLSAADPALTGVCVAGMVLSALLMAGVTPLGVLPLLWIAYLSLSVIGQDFLAFQWDALLLETGLLSIVIAPRGWLDRRGDATDPPRLGLWLMRWLLFRLMLGSGLVKLASGDPTWHSFTALTFHYETQPIPTPLAWYAHLLPPWFHQLSTFATLAVELVLPFFVFGSGRWRRIAFCGFVALQALIALTGNYAFFNLLSASLCVFLLDDVVSLRGSSRGGSAREDSVHNGAARRAVLIAVAAIYVPVSAVIFASSIGVILPGTALVEPIASAAAPLRSINSYGLFAVMTTTRPEIVIEGSNDQAVWLPYEFKYKAGDPDRRPPWVAPFQPRLDWQMWFAALARADDSPWFGKLCVRLLEGSPDVRRLLARDPFDGRPPKYIRAVLYRYRFADRRAHADRQVWWTRELVGLFSPPIAKP